MKYSNIIFCLILAVCLIGCAATKKSASKLPKNLTINKDVNYPSDVKLAYYFPQNYLNARFELDYVGVIRPGNALKESFEAVTKNYFKSTDKFDIKSDNEFEMLIDIEPEWKYKDNKLTYSVNYQVYDSKLNKLMGSSMSNTETMDFQYVANSYYNTALELHQRMVVSILNKLNPDKEQFGSQAAMSTVPADILVNLDEPTSNGTGILLNDTGDVMTAAHVTDNCLLSKVSADGKTYVAKQVASSPLLDLAVLNSDIKQPSDINIRRSGDLKLGEKLTTVSYPLKGMLAASPNMTFGNVSSKKALQGSLGLFQFTAPIQPGSSGGPVVADNGELIGLVTSTLNISSLVEQGVVPQNVNFALNSKYIGKFLDKNNITYQSTTALSKPGIEVALTSAVQISCYQ
jgi:S1-C subfamily serine protease